MTNRKDAGEDVCKSLICEVDGHDDEYKGCELKHWLSSAIDKDFKKFIYSPETKCSTLAKYFLEIAEIRAGLLPNMSHSCSAFSIINQIFDVETRNKKDCAECFPYFTGEPEDELDGIIVETSQEIKSGEKL